MKKAVLSLIAFFVFLGQTPQLEGKFSVRIDQWAGLFSDEFIHPNPNTAVDMMNFMVKNEGGRSFLEQRPGWISVYPPIPGGVTSISAMYISQIASDTERIIIAHSDGEFYQIAPNAATPSWFALSSGGGNTSVNSNFVQFKDTILATGNLQIRRFAKRNGSAGISQTHEYTGVPYERLFLHQDRIYGYGINVDSTDSKLVWWPEFSLFIRPDSLDSAFVTKRGGWVYIDKDDGDFITNVLPMDNHIIVYKSRATYRVLVSPSTNEPNEIVRVLDNIGAYGYDCATEWNGMHYFIAENGVYEFDGVNVTKISTPINYWFADSIVQSTGQAKVFKSIVAVDGKLFLSLPVRTSISQASIVGDSRHFVYDLELKVWYKLDFNGASTASGNESHFLLRYEYSPACTYSLLGGAGGAGIKYFGQRLIFTIDSSLNGKDKICMFPEGWKDNGLDSIEAYWSGAFSPLGDLQKRYSYERFLAYGRCGTRDTFPVWFRGVEDTTLIDSAFVTFGTTPTLANKRINSKVQGSMLRYTIRTRGGAPKINYIEIVGQEKGMGDDTE